MINKPLFLFVAVISFIIGQLTVASWEKFFLDSWLQNYLLLKCTAISILFILLLICVYHFRRVLLQPINRLPHSKPPSEKPVLILFLSNLKGSDIGVQGYPKWFEPTWNFKCDIAKLAQLKSDAEKKFWSWEMPLHAIQHHLGELKVVAIVASKESILQAYLFHDYLANYPELRHLQVKVIINNKNNQVDVINCPRQADELSRDNGWDFEDFDKLSKALDRGIKKMHNESVIKTDSEVMIDFTGGQKVTAIVTCAVTYNREVSAQYVSTVNNEVRGYNLYNSEVNEKELGL
ncbi:MAG: hypothetical protein R3B84_14040 [Zavarzinella sp.]